MRVKRLPFIPSSVNFSQLSPKQENDLFDDKEQESFYNEIDKEILLLKALNSLNSDKERCVMLLDILREYGYQLDYSSVARSLHIELRWFMRVKKNVRNKVQKITTNAS